MKKIMRYVISVFALVGAGCTLLPTVAGNSAETGNGRVLGHIVDTTGAGVAHAVVTMHGAAFDPVKDQSSGWIDTTGLDGKYLFEGLDAGSYTVFAKSPDNRTSTLIPDLVVESSAVSVPDGMLQEPGFLKINLPSSVNPTDGYVYIPGTSIYMPLAGATDAIVIDSVPAGVIPVVKYTAANSTSAALTLGSSALVKPCDTFTITYAEWKYSKKLIFNVPASGANLYGIVTEFPFLVKLSAVNFTFSQAAGDGSDLRFTKSDGTPLPYEIERWNAAAQSAAVWVKVDTIYPYDSTQSITMFYGNPDAASESNGPAVFDTANGFVGVWHLNEATGMNAKDATHNRYDGIPSPSKPTLYKQGFRDAKRFDGKSQYITMPNTANSRLNFPEDGTYSISAWVSVDTTLASRQVMVSKGDLQYTLEIRDTNRWAITEFKDLIGWDMLQSNWKENPNMGFTRVPSKTWVLVTGVRSGGKEYFWIHDGLCTDTTNFLIQSVKSRLTNVDLSIGRVDDATAPCYFGGAIDEVRIYNRALSREWIRLCFRNQNATDMLIRFQ